MQFTGIPSEDASRLEKRGNCASFLFEGLVWLFYRHLCNRNTFLLRMWAPNAQPCWFAHCDRTYTPATRAGLFHDLTDTNHPTHKMATFTAMFCHFHLFLNKPNLESTGKLLWVYFPSDSARHASPHGVPLKLFHRQISGRRAMILPMTLRSYQPLKSMYWRMSSIGGCAPYTSRAGMFRSSMKNTEYRPKGGPYTPLRLHTTTDNGRAESSSCASFCAAEK